MQKTNTLLILASLVIIIAALKLASKVFIILFLAIIFASLLSPIVSVLQKLKFPKILALITTLTLVFVTLLLFFNILNKSAGEFAYHLPSYQEKLLILSQEIDNFFKDYKLDLDVKSIIEGVNFSSLFTLTTQTAFKIGNFLSNFVLIVIGTFFLLAEADNFNSKLEALFAKNKNALKAVEYFSATVKSYFFIKVFTSALTGILVGIMLYFFEINYAILWGFLAFILNFIPVVGSIIASIPAILLSLIDANLSTTLWLIVGYLLINNLISNVLEPKIMGEGLGLSPSIIFFSLIFWGYIFGAVGMFLAVILTMSIKIALDSNEETKHIAKFLGS